MRTDDRLITVSVDILSYPSHDAGTKENGYMSHKDHEDARLIFPIVAARAPQSPTQ